MNYDLGQILETPYWGEFEQALIPRKLQRGGLFNESTRRNNLAGNIMAKAVLDLLAGADTYALNEGVIINPTSESVAPYELPGSVIAIDEEVLCVTGLPSGRDPFLEQDESTLSSWQQVIRNLEQRSYWPIIHRIGRTRIPDLIKQRALKNAEDHNVLNGFRLDPVRIAGVISRQGIFYSRRVEVLSIVEGRRNNNPYLNSLRGVSYEADATLTTSTAKAHQMVNLEGGNSNVFVTMLNSSRYDIAPMVVGRTVQYISEKSPRYTLRRVNRVEVLENGTRAKVNVPKFSIKMAARFAS